MLWRLFAVLIAFSWAAICTAEPLWLKLDSIEVHDPYEGVWQMTGGGAIFSTEAVPGITDTYRLTLLWSPDLSVPSGSVLGEMQPAGRPLVFDASLGLDHKGGRHIGIPGKKYRFELEFSADMRRVSFRPYKRSWKVNIFRWLPYLFRTSVSKTDTRPADMDGAVRLGGLPATSIIEL